MWYALCLKINLNVEWMAAIAATPLYKVETPSQFYAWYLLWKERRHFFNILMHVLLRCFMRMEEYIPHIQPWPASFNKYYIHPRVRFHRNVFPCVKAWSSIKWFTPFWRMSFTYLQQHFFKAYHNHGPKWTLKGFLSQSILHHTTPSIFQQCVRSYILNKMEEKMRLRFYIPSRIQSAAST